MSLLDDLRAAGQALDPQFQPNSNEIQKVLGSLVYYAEHGDAFLEAAEKGVEDVSQLLQPDAPEPEPTPPAPPAAAVEPQPEQSDEELDRQIADLQAQQAARRATAQQTTVEHETGGGDVEPATKPTQQAAPHLNWLHRGS